MSVAPPTAQAATIGYGWRRNLESRGGNGTQTAATDERIGKILDPRYGVPMMGTKAILQGKKVGLRPRRSCIVVPSRSLVHAVLLLFTLAGPALPGYATVFLNQTNWTTAARTTQLLPTNSAWFGPSGTSGSMSVSGAALRQIVTTSSGMAITYFTSNSASAPVQLNVGDTLTASFSFTFNGIPAGPLASQGFKFGMFNFNGGSNSPLRVSADGFSSSTQGSFVDGYALFGKVYQTFADDQPIDIRKRTLVSDGGLLSASADWTSQAKDHINTNGFGGFVNLTQYSLQFIIQRTNLTSLAVTVIWSNTVNGLTLSDSAVDNLATNFYFDGIAYRPQNNTQAPATNLTQQVKIEVTSAPVAPTIVNPPQDLTLSSGQTATFTAIANGTLPLFCQWFRDTNTLVGASTINFPPAHTLVSNPSVALTNVQTGDAGGYMVVVSNVYGSVTSSVANLTVNLVQPTITGQPQDLTVIPGQYATFSVTAVGSEPFGYQWYYNTSSLLTNANGSTLILTNVQPGDAGSYSVIVTNPLGFSTSSNAVLTVNTNPSAPVFITQPASSNTVRIGDSTSFIAAAVGTQPITYQWKTNNFPIPSATAPTLNLTSIQVTDAGTYTVVASNSVGSTTSSNAVLVVIPRTPPLPIIPPNTFIVTNFGAVGDGVMNNAGAIQSTIAAATNAGGGIVEIPSAGTLSTYLSGPITLFSNIDLQVDAGATLEMLPRASWPAGPPDFITASGVNDIAITGAGTIEGQGSTWWPFNLTESQKPNMVNFGNKCTRVLIQGVTFQNAPVFHLMLKGNNVSVTVQDVTINTPFPGSIAPNTDGIDLASTNVLIQNCSIASGDDNIEIGGSGGPAADVVISNCHFLVGHGVSIGSNIQGGIHDLIVSNCSFLGTDQGIRMKSDRDAGGLVQNLQYMDLTMTNVGYAILIYSYYNSPNNPNNITPTIAANNAAQPLVDLTPIWRNIVISNITVGTTTGSNIGGLIWGRPEALVSNITLCKVNIATPTKTFNIYNAQGVRIIDSTLTGTSTTNTLTVYNADITVSNSAPSANVVRLGGIVRPQTNNVFAFFNTPATITSTNVLGASPITLGSSILTFSQGSVNSSNDPITVVADSTLAVSSGNNTLNGALSGLGALTVNLPATTRLALQGDSSGFGGTLVVSNSGTLLVNNTVGSGTGTGAVIVVSGATLGGSGVIGGPVAVSGTLAPGNSPGTLTISNDLVVSGGAVWQYDLGTSSDLTVVSGNSTLGGILNVTDSGGFTNGTYTLLTYGGTLTYNGISIGTLPSGFGYAIDTGTVGQVKLTVSPPLTAFQQWQVDHFGSTTNSAAAASADPDGDGQNNQAEFLSGTDPKNSLSALQIISVTRQTTDVTIVWTTGGGRTNAVQTTSGSYTTNFVDLTGSIIIPGTGDVTNNYVDSGGATNKPSRYYRIRLVP